MAKIENLLVLENISPQEILYHLKSRYDEKLIYTYAGKILISINPFQITNLYYSDIQSYFLNKINQEHGYIIKDPHLY